MMSPRLAVLPIGDRLVTAAVQGSRVETFVVDAENPAEALRAELEQRRLTARSVAIGLPRTAVTVKPIELPAVDGEVREMVSFQLERHLPFPSDGAAFDFAVLPSAGAAAGGRQVVIVAADRRVVEGALRVAEHLQLRAVSLTVASHNLIALVGRRRRGERVVWIHRVGDETEVLFLDGDTIALSRTIAGADPTALVSEIQRSWPLIRWRGCDAIWLSGDEGGTLASALDDFDVAVGAPPYTRRARRLRGAISESARGLHELALAVAVGGRERPLELLPSALRPRRLTRTQKTTAGVAAATVLLALAALLATGVRENRRLAAIDARMAALDPDVRATERVLQDLERRRRLLAVIHSLESGSMQPLPVLRELTELLPDDAWLTAVTFDTRGVELTGQAAAAIALIPILENSPRLRSVEFSSAVTGGRFRIRAAWESPPGGTAAPAGSPPTPAKSRPR